MIFKISGKNEANDLAVRQLQGSTIAIIFAHVPGPYMWAIVDLGPIQVIQSSGSQNLSDGRVDIYNSVSVSVH